MIKKAIFCDRDDTLIYNVPYLSDPGKCALITQILPVLKNFAAQGYLFFIVTNQSGIARGFYSVQDAERVNDKVIELYRQQGIVFTKAYLCPHHPDAGTSQEFKINCSCRKPMPGMLLQAAEEFDIDLSKSYMIGDRESDMLAGSAAGCKTIIMSDILSGKCII